MLHSQTQPRREQEDGSRGQVLEMLQVYAEAYPLSSRGEVHTRGSAVRRPDDDNSPRAQGLDGDPQKIGGGDEVLHEIIEHDRVDRAGLRQTLTEVLIHGQTEIVSRKITRFP